MQALIDLIKELIALFSDFLKSKPTETPPPVVVSLPDSAWERVIYYLAQGDFPAHVKTARLAQWILESNRGTSPLAKLHNNYGGFKYRSEIAAWATSVSYGAHDGVDQYAHFHDIEDFIAGAEAFMQRAPYKNTWQNTTTAKDYIKSIIGIYATDLKYFDKVSALIPEAETLLKKFTPEPDRPDQPPPIIIEDDIQAPNIVYMADVSYKTHGQYNTTTGMAKGLVVHYTVSGRTSQSAKGVVKYMAGQGLGCMVMDESGVIYVPKNFDPLKTVAYHAGVSSWKGLSGISTFCMGMEICNWGTDGKKMGATDLRTSPHNVNIKAGTYQMYTAAQEKALINFCLWVKKNNPSFDFGWVVGHDEIAPTRKSDPGASLSMTMPAFRQLLESKWK